MFTTAITRKPGKNFTQGITSAELGPPDYDRMLAQHAAYSVVLAQIGLEIVELNPLPEYPDAHFVEDVAVITPDVAVITNPGADARSGEQLYIEPVLSHYRELAHIRPPGTLDGGDVLMVDGHFFIGVSARTNQHGAAQLGAILERFGYTWRIVPVGAGLHLKSSVNWVGEKTLLVSPDYADHPALESFTRVIVDPDEAYACNTLWVNGTLLTPAGFSRTREQLDGLGHPVIEIATSEVRKMDGGLTCLSLRF